MTTSQLLDSTYTAHQCLALYGQAVEARLNHTSFKFKRGIMPTADGHLMMNMELWAHTFRFRVSEVIPEKEWRNAIHRRTLTLDGHSPDSFAVWALRCEETMHNLYRNLGVATYIYEMQKLVGNTHWLGYFPSEERANRPAIYVDFSTSVWRDGIRYKRARVILMGTNCQGELNEITNAPDIALSRHVFEPLESQNQHADVLNQDVLFSPYPALLRAAVSVAKQNHFHIVNLGRLSL